MSSKATGIDVKNGVARGVTTSNNGNIEGDVIVLSAGLYTQPLASTVGIRVPILPVKGYCISGHTSDILTLLFFVCCVCFVFVVAGVWCLPVFNVCCVFLRDYMRLWLHVCLCLPCCFQGIDKCFELSLLVVFVFARLSLPKSDCVCVFTGN